MRIEFLFIQYHVFSVLIRFKIVCDFETDCYITEVVSAGNAGSVFTCSTPVSVPPQHDNITL